MKNLSAAQKGDLLKKLCDRFEMNEPRHKGIKWQTIETVLNDRVGYLNSLYQMEITGGEPDVICWPNTSNQLAFVDCSVESPAGRRSLCYDESALKARKANKPSGSAMEMAIQMGIKILTEAEYKNLQTLGNFDLKTSSWLQTPVDVREKGGAIFGDRRYGRVFIYHNGAESYYAARGFRGILRLSAGKY